MGSERLPNLVFNGTFRTPPAYQLLSGNNRIVLTDQTGKAHIIRLDGTTFQLQLPVGGNRFVQFELADIVGDEQKDYIVLSQRNLNTYYYTGRGFEKRFQYTFEYPQDTLFAVTAPRQSKQLLGTGR